MRNKEERPTQKGSHESEPSASVQESNSRHKGGGKESGGWVEIAATILLSLAVITTAWCAYQSTRWSGLMAINFSEAAANRTEAAIYSTRAGQETVVDASIFLDFAVLYLQDGSMEMLTLYKDKLFTDRLEVAMDAWLATEPFKNPDAPRNPFEMDAYVSESMQASEEFSMKAEVKTNEAKENNQQADNYVLLTVLFASVLFFGGVSSKFRNRWVQIAMLLLGVMIFVLTAVALSSQSIY